MRVTRCVHVACNARPTWYGTQLCPFHAQALLAVAERFCSLDCTRFVYRDGMCEDHWRLWEPWPAIAGVA